MTEPTPPPAPPRSPDRAGPAARRPRVLGLALVLLSLLVLAAGLHATTDLHPPTVISLAALGAATVGWFFARKLATALALLALLTWAGAESRLDPILLWEHRDRATEYVFGKPLSEDDRAAVRRQAESLVSMRFREDAAQAVANRLGLERDDPRPENFESLVDRQVDRMRAETSIEQWNRRVQDVYGRLARDKRGGYFPPETDPEKIERYLRALVETVAIAVWGTALAVVIAAPAAMLASKRSLEILTPGSSIWRRGLRRLGVFLGRRGFDACRGFNEFVLALIFVAILGLGPFAGVLALAVHTFGYLGKVFSDAVESARTGEIEGVAATGAGPAQTVSFAIIPQVMPIVVSQSLLRFESNVRSASVLGLVGAGGIGFLIDAKMKSYQFREVATMMILIIIAVSLIDLACGRVMKRFV